MERLTLRDDNGRALLTPYGLRIYCSTQATADCICKLEEALQAQEQRVMTLEEVENALDTVVWVDRPTAKNESKLFGLIQAYSRKFKFVQIKHIEMNMGEHMLYPYETYGKEWRCWTSRPTDEQREKVKWDGQA